MTATMQTIIPCVAIVIGCALGYLCGAIPVGLIVGRKVHGIDIREHGSGNVGTTNAIRILGVGPGIVVMCGDILKGMLAVVLMFAMLELGETCWALGGGTGALGISGGWIQDLAGSLALSSAVIGHMYSPFMHFKGGKGIATAFGALCIILPWSALICLIILLVLVITTRYMSLGSICATLSLPITCALIHPGHPILFWFCVLVCLLILYAHKGNIVRLVHGTERKFSVGSSKHPDSDGDASHKADNADDAACTHEGAPGEHDERSSR